MRIGRICRLRSPLHFKIPAMQFAVLAAAAGLVFAPALAQEPLGAAAAAAGAAVEATAAAPAPALKKNAASTAIAADMGNGAAGRATSNQPTEEATNGATPAGDPALTAATPPALPLKGVAAQCANLLKMAATLKSEVDKTSKDVLSVAVVREASQIEETAKKMRQQQH